MLRILALVCKFQQDWWPVLTVISVSPTESLSLNEIPPNLSLHYSPTAISDVPHDSGTNTPCDTDAAVSSETSNSSCHPDHKALLQTPLPPGKTLILYHPHAQYPPEIIDTATLSLAREPQPFTFSSEPWAPFASRDDFEQAELFIKHHCTNRLINDQLRLNQRRDSSNHDLQHPPSMKNAREMHQILEEAESDLDVSLVC